MTPEWHYEEGGGAFGPVTAAEIAERIRLAPNKPHLVWKAGMVEWADARALPNFMAVVRVEESSPRLMEKLREDAKRSLQKDGSLRQRARHELISYLVISGYLLVWFSALLFYKAAILKSVGIDFAPFGLAAVKALILGKFILTLQAFKIGERKQGGAVLAVAIVEKALLFTLLLIVLTIAEELVSGYFHGKAAKESLQEIGGGTLPQAIASSVLMFLVLLPYFALTKLASSLGQLPDLLFKRRSE